MKVVVFGASGMVGGGALLECLEDPRIESILVVGRRSCGVRDPKVTEILHRDFFDYAAIQPRFADVGACFFCLGVSSLGMGEAEYTRLTHDLTLAAARSMAEVNRRMTFCYVSGAGTDGSERGRVMWARVKGKTENALRRLPFGAAYMLRPGFILPVKGVRSRTRLYRAFYAALGFLYPVLRRIAPGMVTTSECVGRALVRLAVEGYPRKILETRDINRLGEGGASA